MWDVIFHYSRCTVTFASYHIVPYHIVSAHGRCPWADIHAAYSRINPPAVSRRVFERWGNASPRDNDVGVNWRYHRKTADGINRGKDDLYRIRHDVCLVIVHIRFRTICVCDVVPGFVYI